MQKPVAIRDAIAIDICNIQPCFLCWYCHRCIKDRLRNEHNQQPDQKAICSHCATKKQQPKCIYRSTATQTPYRREWKKPGEMFYEKG